MAKFGINLIPGEQRSSFEILKLQKQIRLVSLICVTILIFSLLITFSLLFSLNLQMNDLALQITDTSTKIDSFRQREGDLSLLKNRLGLIDKIVKSRIKTPGFLADLQGIIPQGVVLENVDAGMNNEMKITITSVNLFFLNQFIEQISHPDFTKNLKSINISSVNRSAKGSYSFILNLSL